MMRQLPIAAFIALSLAGCAGGNKAIPKNYYVLGIEDGPVQQQTAPNSSGIALTNVRLANYLNEQGIAMILTDNRINIARNALWGEQLHRTVPRVLVDDLKRACACPVVQGSGAGLPGDEDSHKLAVRIDRFGPTDQGQVVLSGEFQLSGPGASSVVQPFYFTQELSADGYAAAVRDMRQLLPELAGLIDTARSAVQP